MGRAMRAMKGGTGPKTEQNSPAYLKKPISAMSMAQETATQRRRVRCSAPSTTFSAQNQDDSAMNISSSTYTGSPQA